MSPRTKKRWRGVAAAIAAVMATVAYAVPTQISCAPCDVLCTFQPNTETGSASSTKVCGTGATKDAAMAAMGATPTPGVPGCTDCVDPNLDCISSVLVTYPANPFVRCIYDTIQHQWICCTVYSSLPTYSVTCTCAIEA